MISGSQTSFCIAFAVALILSSRFQATQAILYGYLAIVAIASVVKLFGWLKARDA